MIRKVSSIASILVLFLVGHVAMSQDKFTISGYLKDVANGEGIIGGAVYVKELKTGASTNAYGFYSITVPVGSYTLTFSSVGYKTLTKSVQVVDKNIKIDLEIQDETKLLDEVVVRAEAEDRNVKSMEMSVNKIDMKTIKAMPALLGEVDLVKSIQLLPGVSTVGEGSTGFNVRGGTIDQNLILLDDAPVYNSSHLFGFFSVFNPDAVRDVKLLKGGIPAQYGGRLSSLLDVRMKEGNNKRFEVDGGVGAIFSRLSLEGPIIKDKLSFIVAVRRSYADVLAKPFLQNDLKDSQFYFFDLTSKLSWIIDKKNSIFVSGYFGRDVFGADFGFNWGNATGSIRWNHIFNDRLFLNTTAYISDYDYKIDTDLRNKTPNDRFGWASKILSYSVRPEFTYYLNPNNTLTFGVQTILYDFKPGTANFTSNGETRDISLPDKYALESAAYIGNEHKISDDFSLQYGVRFSLYNLLGPGEINTYKTDRPLGLRQGVASTRTYASGQNIQTYSNLEPRLALRYSLSPSTSLKASYNRMSQYLHLLSNTTASIPLDVWAPSNPNIKPQIADQYALGVFKNFNDNTYEASVEVYYKDLQNQIDYIDGAELLLNRNLEGDLLNGKGRAYGAEFFVKKNKGKLTGWIAYTLARTERQVAGINKGEWYPNRFDRTHSLKIVTIYQPTPKWNFGANFSYETGTPVTLPQNRFEFQGLIGSDIGTTARNSYRIPDYWRLDLSATLNKKPKARLFGQRMTESNWVFAVYNVFARRNPFSVFARQPVTASGPPQIDDYLNGKLTEKAIDYGVKTEAVKYSIFGSFIPSVTYNFKF
jgi:hypothetical protein